MFVYIFWCCSCLYVICYLRLCSASWCYREAKRRKRVSRFERMKSNFMQPISNWWNNTKWNTTQNWIKQRAFNIIIKDKLCISLLEPSEWVLHVENTQSPCTSMLMLFCMPILSLSLFSFPHFSFLLLVFLSIYQQINLIMFIIVHLFWSFEYITWGMSYHFCMHLRFELCNFLCTMTTIIWRCFSWLLFFLFSSPYQLLHD